MKNFLVAAIAALLSVTASASTTSIYCQSLPNSTGQTAQIGYVGSLVRADNALTMNMSNASHGFAQLTCGIVPMNVPFGNGMLCINPIPYFARIGGPVAVVNGTTQRAVDLSVLPQASTLYFQWWYRDTPQESVTFNTSNGMACTLD